MAASASGSPCFPKNPAFTRRGQAQGLGVVGSNQTGALPRGLHLHTTLAVNSEGIPLGVLRARFDAPPPPDPEATGPKAREDITVNCICPGIVGTRMWTLFKGAFAGPGETPEQSHAR